MTDLLEKYGINPGLLQEVLEENDTVKKLDPRAFRATLTVNDREIPSVCMLDYSHGMKGVIVHLSFEDHSGSETMFSRNTEKVLHLHLDLIHLYRILKRLVEDEVIDCYHSLAVKIANG